MSILIKGMEMPKEGTVMVVDSTGQVWVNQWPTRGYTRIDKVKAVELPPHGDLIDREMLLALLPDVWLDIEHCGYIEDTVYGQSIERIQNAPTIIEAEVEE